VTITPTIAVVGSFALLVVAAVIFIAVLVRHRGNVDRDNGARHHPATLSRTEAAHRLDTSLDGVNLGVSKDAPSAVLLTPLRTSEWMPPETPAPAEELSSASLAERIAEFEPAPEIPEPAFSVERHPEWQVAQVVEEPPAAAALGERVPDVHPVDAPTPPKVMSDRIAATVPAVTDEDLDAEIAALLPQAAASESSDASLEPVYADVEVTPRQASDVDTVPAIPQHAEEPAAPPQWTFHSLESDIAPEQHAEAPTIVTIPEPVADMQAPEPVPSPPTAQEEAVEPAEDAFWSGMLAEQQGVQPAAATSGPAPVSARPVVRVTTAQPPAPEPAPAPSERHAPRARATIRIHAIPEADEVDGGATPVLAPIEAGPRGADIPEMVLETPVEMWFGDSRIGVKPGSATYDKFRKYADALLADLNESKPRADKV